jgi:hypothetical protein
MEPWWDWMGNHHESHFMSIRPNSQHEIKLLFCGQWVSSIVMQRFYTLLARMAIAFIIALTRWVRTLPILADANISPNGCWEYLKKLSLGLDLTHILLPNFNVVFVIRQSFKAVYIADGEANVKNQCDYADVSLHLENILLECQKQNLSISACRSRIVCIQKIKVASKWS